ncbi:hypothetical protein RSOLAG1IB_10812 [Rhizoctonia solani AG-1 IB]|uniref:Uncharacterized protein n=1 Tax=Thanatephorus cucumeris (strain AG1-IB / isolate 7/3/14) TaxID=1108050 RepID=A0A0B7G321_THACB|nr:hypothetical protein RSOLAG1IB_10812 [Rhizoctonia solani AG-1 IB]
MEFLPSMTLFDVRNWVVVVTGSEVEITNPLADILSRSGAHIYVCQPFLSDNDVPGEEQYPGQTFINMDETSKASIANAVRIVETRERCVNLLINVNSRDSGAQGKRASWDSFFSKPGATYSDQMSQQTHEVEDWDRVFGTNISSSYFIASAFGSLLRSGAENYGTGCVINVSRPGKPVVVGGYALPTLYSSRLIQPSTSDTALQQLNNLLATELNLPTQYRIRVNAIVLRQPAVTSCAVAQSVVSCATNAFINGATVSLE